MTPVMSVASARELRIRRNICAKRYLCRFSSGLRVRRLRKVSGEDEIRQACVGHLVEVGGDGAGEGADLIFPMLLLRPTGIG